MNIAECDCRREYVHNKSQYNGIGWGLFAHKRKSVPKCSNGVLAHNGTVWYKVPNVQQI
jgi:hypothetical protein